MRHLKTFKLFEEAVPKPLKKFPTEPAVHWNYLMKVLEDAGINPHDGLVKGQRDTYFQDFLLNVLVEIMLFSLIC
jgi:hypothetical protein